MSFLSEVTAPVLRLSQEPSGPWWPDQGGGRTSAPRTAASSPVPGFPLPMACNGSEGGEGGELATAVGRTTLSLLSVTTFCSALPPPSVFFFLLLDFSGQGVS